MRVEAEAATIGELKRRDRAPLRVRDVRIEVDRLLINPQRLMRTGAIEVLDAGELRIDAPRSRRPTSTRCSRASRSATG